LRKLLWMAVYSNHTAGARCCDPSKGYGLLARICGQRRDTHFCLLACFLEAIQYVVIMDVISSMMINIVSNNARNVRGVLRAASRYQGTSLRRNKPLPRTTTGPYA